MTDRGTRNTSRATAPMKRADIVVIVLAILWIGYLYNNTGLSHGLAQQARIITPGQKDIIIPLTRNASFDIEGPLGISTIVVDSGKARFLKSPCQGKQCVRSGWLERNGTFAACLPNRVSLFLEDPDQAYDTINY